MTDDWNALADWLMVCSAPSRGHVGRYRPPLTERDAEMRALLAERSQRQIDPGKAPKGGNKRRLERAVRQALRRSYPHQRAWG